MMVLCFALAAIAPALLESLRHWRWESRWADRGIKTRNVRALLIARVATSWLLAGAWSTWWASPSFAVALSAFLWLGFTVFETDLLSQKIPREACWYSMGIGVIAGLTTLSWAGVASFAVALIALSIGLTIVVFASRGRFGDGDVRLILSFTPFAFWVGSTTVMLAVIFGCGIQIVVRLVLWLARRHRKFLAFGPSLVAGVVAALLYAPPSSAVSPCLEWFGLIPC